MEKYNEEKGDDGSEAVAKKGSERKERGKGGEKEVKVQEMRCEKEKI